MLPDSLSAIAAASPSEQALHVVKQQKGQKPQQGQRHLNAAGFPAASPGASTLALSAAVFFNAFHKTTDKFKKPAYYPKHIWHSGRALGKQTDGLLSWSVSASSTS